MERYKVLIIEDDEQARSRLAKAVRKEGFDVTEAENGKAGLEIFKKDQPEIIISDLKMPGVDGLEVIHWAKRIWPHVQVILITASGEDEVALMALREGALDYIKKPIEFKELELALGRAKEKVAEYVKAKSFPMFLLAEDDVSTRQRLSETLQKEGWQMATAADGEEALEIFEKEKIDIVLLDIRMPKMDGLTLLKRMRKVTDDFEAVVMTGFGDEANIVTAMRSGAVNFLKKPIDLDQLAIVIEKALEKLNLSRSLKYRNRELKLTRQLIARITTNGEIVIDERDPERKVAWDFAQKLLGAIPMGLCVLDRKMKIVYINRFMTEAFESRPNEFNQAFLEKLDKVGIKGLSYDSLLSSINKIFDSPKRTIETVQVGKYGYLTLVGLAILKKAKEEKVVLIASRGERKQK